VATYETASTRKYYNGRTETLRSCTTESLEWARSMLDPLATVEKSFYSASHCVISVALSVAHGQLASNVCHFALAQTFTRYWPTLYFVVFKDET